MVTYFVMYIIKYTSQNMLAKYDLLICIVFIYPYIWAVTCIDT